MDKKEKRTDEHGNPKHVLKDRYFLEIKGSAPGKVERWGQVLGVVGYELAMVKFFTTERVLSPADFAPREEQRLVPTKDMLDWTFYDSREEWAANYILRQDRQGASR